MKHASDGQEPAERPLAYELLDEACLRVMPVHERLREHEAGALRRRERCFDLAGMARVRLLAEHVLAGGERLHRPLVVKRVRKRDVYGVDFGVREQGLVAPVRAGDAVLRRIRVGLRARTAAHGRDLDLLGVARRREDLVVDAGSGQQSETQRAHGCNAG